MFPTLKWRRETFLPDLGAGLSVALVSIPEGMAYAMVAGVNPIYGLYTGMLTTIVASLTANTSLLIVTATNALALVTAEHMAGLGKDVDPARALFTLTMLVGVIMFVLGVLRMGSVIRFVSREIMTGFVFATALIIVLGQLKDFVGYTSSLDSGKLVKAIDIVFHRSEWNTSDTIVGFASIGVLLLLGFTPLKHWAGLLAILLSSLFVYVAAWDQVKIVGDLDQVEGCRRFGRGRSRLSLLRSLCISGPGAQQRENQTSEAYSGAFVHAGQHTRNVRARRGGGR